MCSLIRADQLWRWPSRMRFGPPRWFLIRQLSIQFRIRSLDITTTTILGTIRTITGIRVGPSALILSVRPRFEVAARLAAAGFMRVGLPAVALAEEFPVADSMAAVLPAEVGFTVE